MNALHRRPEEKGGGREGTERRDTQGERGREQRGKADSLLASLNP